MFRSPARPLVTLISLSSIVFAQTTAKPAAKRTANAAEQRAARAFSEARKSPLALSAFLVRMPKGGDLHSHLSGAVSAETFIRDAVDDGLCYSPATRSLFRPSAPTRSIPPQPVCGEGNRRAEDALKDQKLYDAMVDDFSMRSFVPSAGVSGHDQFFATFSRFGAVKRTHVSEWIDEVAARAAAQNEQYLEVMQTPDLAPIIRLASTMAWPQSSSAVLPSPANPPQDAIGTSREELAKLRDHLLAGGLHEITAAHRQELADALESRNKIEHCGSSAAVAACAVKVRFLYQVLRGNPPEQVFTQTLDGFEVIQAELDSGHPNVVGINFVMPEDGYLSMSEYHRQML